MATEHADEARMSLDSRTASSADSFADAQSHLKDDSSAPVTPTAERREATPDPAPQGAASYFPVEDNEETPRRRETVNKPESTITRSETIVKVAPPVERQPTPPQVDRSASPSPSPSARPQEPSRAPSEAAAAPKEQEPQPVEGKSPDSRSSSSLGSHGGGDKNVGEKPSSTVERATSPVKAVEEKEDRGEAKEQNDKKEGGEEEASSEEATEDAEDETNYVKGVKLYLLTLGLFLATFVIALDNTIIATAIPRITTDFDSINDVGWYGSSYLLTTTSLQPSFGKIYSYFNVKWAYVIALVVFEVGSIICATAPNSVALIVGRAIAGVGAAALFSGGMTIVGYSVPLRNRALYIAILSSTFGIASIVGPILGGIFTDNEKLTWRFCFWINLPIGGLAIVTTILFFTSPKREASELTFGQKIRKMDLGGAGVLIAGIVCLLLALQWGGSTYPWNDSRVWGCLLGFGLIIILFIGLQLYIGDNATIPRRILTQRPVAVGVAFTMFLSMALFAHVFYLPFYFQAVKGTTAEGSGIRTIPYLVSNTLASLVVGAAVTVFGPYTPFLWVGSAVFTVGSGLLFTLGVDDGAARWIGWQLIAGIGAGSAIQVPFISVQTVLPPADMPTGNALTIFFNTLGGALSVSICQTIFSNKLTEELARSVPPRIVSLVQTAGATNVHRVTPPEFLPQVLNAYDIAVTRAFIVPIATGGLAFLISLFMPWGSVKGKKLMMGGA